ncbi:MAG: hypothetical protein M5U26_28330 [Planctomycetota bacterium]|nr:hypothetical protein [Planctomycetota bacterium]
MSRMTKVWGVCAALALMCVCSAGWAQDEMGGGEEGAKTGEKEKKDNPKREHGGGFNIPTNETLQEKLGDTKLTEEQAKKIEDLRTSLKTKWDELRASEAYKKAEEDLKAAAEKKDKDAMKAAREELSKATGGFQLLTEFQKGLVEILGEELAKKAMPPRERREKTAKPEKEKKEGGDGEKKEGE